MRPIIALFCNVNIAIDLFMTIKFRKISANDKDLVFSYLPQGEVINCDFSIVNLYGWQLLYNTELAEVDGFLVIRFRANGHITYMLPMGKGNFNKVMEKLKIDADSFGEPLLIVGASKEITEKIEQFSPGCFRFVPDRDVMDYVYLRTDLVELKGKKYQSKRNHINRFKKNFPDYKYLDLTSEHVANCLEMVSLWVIARGERAKNALEAERKMMDRALNNMDALGIKGGVLYVGEKLVAFTFGSQINDITFDVCVEKADNDYPGAYSVINNEFCSRLPINYTYVNREEDLGIDGLRKAKLSYQPILLLEKMTALPVCCDSECWEVKKIYTRSFQDDNEFVDFYFKNRYTALNTVTIKKNKSIAAAVQILDYSLYVWGGNFKTGYLSAGCTMPEYRRQGIMSELISKAHRLMFTQGKEIAALIPANDHLWDYYSKSGYVPGFYIETRKKRASSLNTSKALNEELLSISTPELMDEPLYTFIDTLMRERDNYILHTIGDMTFVLSYYKKFKGVVLVAKRNGIPVGVIFGHRKDGRDDTLIIDESFSVADDVRDALLSKALELSGCDKMMFITPAINNPKRLGMIRIINAQSVLRHYAETHPYEETCFVLTDSAISENEGFYSIKLGVCEYSPFTPNSATANKNKIDISELSQKLFSSCNLFMSLMIND